MKGCKWGVLISFLLISLGKPSAKERLTDMQQLTTGFSFKITSTALGEEKEIYVSLPHKYRERKLTYPVIYTLEAEYLFNITNSIVNFMARRSQIPQAIVIGITNGEYKKRNQMALKNQGGTPEVYLRFIREELIPYVEKNFRANNHRTLIGLSPTNGLLFEGYLQSPELFTGYVALSAHLEWPYTKGSTLIDTLIEASGGQNYAKTKMYLGRADSDLAGNQYVSNAFNYATKALSQTNSNRILLDVVADDEHYVMAIHGIRRALANVFPHSAIVHPLYRKTENLAQNIRQRYEVISEKYGFDTFPVEDGHNYSDHLLGVIHVLERANKFQEAFDVASLALEYYPTSKNIQKKLTELGSKIKTN